MTFIIIFFHYKFSVKNNMSFFLLPQEQIYNNLHRGKQHLKEYKQTEKDATEFLFIGDIIKNELKSMKQCFLGHTIHKNGDERFLLMKIDLGFDLQGLFSIKSSKKNNQFSFSVDVLGPLQTYLKADNIFQAVQICRNIIFQHSCYKQTLVCLKMDPCKRQIKMQLPLFLNNNWPTLKKSYKTNAVISLIVHTLIKPHVQLIENSLRNILIQDGRVIPIDLMFEKRSKFIDDVNNYSLLSNLSTHIPCNHQNQPLFSLRNFQNKKQSINNLYQNEVPIQPFLLLNASLFSYRMPADSICKELTEQLSIIKTQKLMKSKISIPSPSYSEQPQENFMVQNKIQIQNLKDLQLQRIKKGGFANIFLTKIDFWYPYLSDGFTPNSKEQSSVLSQVMVLKMELPPADVFHTEDQQIEKSRRQHQQSIVNKLKTGKSIYIPKYYFPINIQKQKKSILNQSLLMEHIPFRTLSQVLQQNSFYLSLHSKVGLMFSICQGLRYLRDFDIVHLDLKPNNIMTYYKSHIKLIDFGQSYHHQICGDFYQPGYTVPYSAPQIFADKKQYFTSKSDVFSFGVIFYQMLFKRFPYDIYKNTSKLEQQMQYYLQYWYYSAEEGESYGEGKVMRILVGLISKCISLSETDRPQLDSIALILKLILEVIN